MALFAIHFGAYAIGHGSVPGVELAIGALVWAVAWFAGGPAPRGCAAARSTSSGGWRSPRSARGSPGTCTTRPAHAINVIAVQAGAARLLQERDPRPPGGR